MYTHSMRLTLQCLAIDAYLFHSLIHFNCDIFGIAAGVRARNVGKIKIVAGHCSADYMPKSTLGAVDPKTALMLGGANLNLCGTKIGSSRSSESCLLQRWHGIPKRASLAPVGLVLNDLCSGLLGMMFKTLRTSLTFYLRCMHIIAPACVPSAWWRGIVVHGTKWNGKGCLTPQGQLCLSHLHRRRRVFVHGGVGHKLLVLEN